MNKFKVQKSRYTISQNLRIVFVAYPKLIRQVFGGRLVFKAHLPFK